MASAATVCLNLDLLVRVGVPVGRFLLVAVDDVRVVCPCPGMMVCPREWIQQLNNFMEETDTEYNESNDTDFP